MEHVRRQLEGEEGEAPPKYNTQLASHQAYLAKHVTQVLGELRKLEAHDRDAVKRMDPEEADAMVAEYIRDLPVERRAGFLQLIAEICEDAGGVL